MIKLILFCFLFYNILLSQYSRENYLVDSLDLKDVEVVTKSKIDSLINVYNEAVHDTSRINAIGQICQLDFEGWERYAKLHFLEVTRCLRKYQEDEVVLSLKASLISSFGSMGYIYHDSKRLDSSFYYYEKALTLSQELKNKKAEGVFNYNLGNVLRTKGKYVDAINYYERAVKIRDSLNDLRGLTKCLNNIGLTYHEIGQIELALDAYYKALRISEKIDSPTKIARRLNNIGNIFFEQKELEYALEYYRKSLEVCLSNNLLKEQVRRLSNIGNVYYEREKLDSSKVYFDRALNIAVATNGQMDLARCYRNQAKMFDYYGELDSALNCFKKALSLIEKQRNLRYEPLLYCKIAEVYKKKRLYEISDKYFEKGLYIAKEIGAPLDISKAAFGLYEVNKSLNNKEKALQMFELHVLMRDSVYNEKIQKGTIYEKTKYEFDKRKALLDAEHEKELAIVEAERRLQRIVSISVIVGLVMVLSFLVFIYNRLKITKKQKQEIKHQKEVAEFQKKQAEIQTRMAEKHMGRAIALNKKIKEHHKEIQDSINYAKRIQEAIMPSRESLQKDLKDGFVLYLPKDVVAGDFFWKEVVEDKVYFAAADCTGHGVPGAMVSVVCSNALSKSLIEEGNTDTGKLLDRTRELVIARLAKSRQDVKDGMDISLCAIQYNQDGKKIYDAELEWSGANNPLWLLRNNSTEIEVIKPDKQPVGKYELSTPFNSHKIYLNKGDKIFAFTDGFQDQFGGPKGKKFKPKQLKSILINHAHIPMDEIKEVLELKFNQWKGSLEQVDDVCIIGIRI